MIIHRHAIMCQCQHHQHMKDQQQYWSFLCITQFSAKYKSYSSYCLIMGYSQNKKGWKL